MLCNIEFSHLCVHKHTRTQKAVFYPIWLPRVALLLHHTRNLPFIAVKPNSFKGTFSDAHWRLADTFYVHFVDCCIDMLPLLMLMFTFPFGIVFWHIFAWIYIRYCISGFTINIVDRSVVMNGLLWKSLTWRFFTPHKTKSNSKRSHSFSTSIQKTMEKNLLSISFWLQFISMENVFAHFHEERNEYISPLHILIKLESNIFIECLGTFYGNFYKRSF